MTHNMHDVEDYALPLPITQTAQSTAQQFAREQPTPQKAEQVRLNTLAVYAVNDYLQMMGISTNLRGSDSWNPVVRLCADVADLDIPGVGRIECRPVQGNQPTCYIPPEVWSDRIGYLVVEIDDSIQEAKVLGFTQMASEELPLNQLQPPEDILDHLQPSSPPSLPAVPADMERVRVNLSQWLSNAVETVVETSWQSLESLQALFNPPAAELAFRFRRPVAEPELAPNAVRRARLLDLGTQLADDHPVALVVELYPESDEKRAVLLQVHPLMQRHLPPLLELTVLDETGLVFLEAQARNADDYIQLEFTGLPGELFSVRVALGDALSREDFVL